MSSLEFCEKNFEKSTFFLIFFQLYNNLLQIFNQMQNPTYSPTGLVMGPFGMYPANFGVAAAMSNLQQNVQTIQEKAVAQQVTPEQQQQMNMLRYHQELTQRRYAEMAKVSLLKTLHY